MKIRNPSRVGGLFAALSAGLALAAAPAPARAQLSPDHAPTFVLSLSLGQGVVLNPSTDERYSSSAATSPLALELIVGMHVNELLTIDGGFLFAYDVFGTYHDRDKSYYAGFRPGIHLYGGARGSGLRPYFRAAFPITYDHATERTGVGVLLGLGLEFRGRRIGFFGELDASPFFNYGNLIPIELRLGVSFHF